jgi:cold shock CspA family protein
VARGSIISFDRNKGYGFVAPSSGGEDVFLHANDLLDDKTLMVPGQLIEFDLEEGERGPKASRVKVLSDSTGSHHQTDFHQPRLEPAADDECDVLSPAELERELTEALLHVTPVVTGPQILDIRRRVAALARSHGWVED